MTKKSRTILFFICFFLFSISAPLAVFYSQGYRIDFNSKKIVKTGAFYFKIFPKSVQIYLDGKLKKETDFLSSSVLIKNLLPKKYNIEIKKEGYYSWKKDLEIKEGKVIESKNVFLIPENPKFEILSEGVEDFFFSPDGKKIIFKKTINSGWVLEILELGRNKKSLLFEGDLGSQVLELIFSPDSKRIFLRIEEEKKAKNFILDFEGNLISLDFLGEIEKISFNPTDSQKIFFIKLTEEKIPALFEADYNKKEVSQPILTNLIIYEISEENIFWISNEGFLFKSDLSAKRQEKFSIEPFSLKKVSDYQIKTMASKIFLKEDNILYVFNQNFKSFEKFFEPIEDLELSPDNKKIVYYNNHEIWVLFLEEKYDQPQKKAGETLFITRLSEKINKVSWYTSHYLIFDVGDKIRTSSLNSENLDFSLRSKIKIAEIDDRDRINIYDFTEFKGPKILFNKTDGKLYILSERNLKSSSILLP